MTIVTHCVCPPIPVRTMDWIAYDADTYDASYEGEDENGHHWKLSRAGWGATEEEAIADLREQLES